MKNTKKLYTLYEWDLLCRMGLGFEIEEYLKTLLPIECPNFETMYNASVENIRPCKAKIKDQNEPIINFGGQKRQLVYCPTCHWRGTRAIGKK